MSLKTMKFPKASMNKSTSPGFSENNRLRWGVVSGGGRKMNTITLVSGLKGWHVREGGGCCSVLRRAERQRTCGRVVGGGKLAARVRRAPRARACTHACMKHKEQAFGMDQLLAGVSFLTYWSLQLSIRIVIPTFHGYPSIEIFETQYVVKYYDSVHSYCYLWPTVRGLSHALGIG